MHTKDFYDHISTSHSQDGLHHPGSPHVSAGSSLNTVCFENSKKYCTVFDTVSALMMTKNNYFYYYYYYIAAHYLSM